MWIFFNRWVVEFEDREERGYGGLTINCTWIFDCGGSTPLTPKQSDEHGTQGLSAGSGQST